MPRHALNPRTCCKIQRKRQKKCRTGDKTATTRRGCSVACVLTKSSSDFFDKIHLEGTKQTQNKKTLLLFSKKARTFYSAFFFPVELARREFLVACQAQEMKWILTAGGEQKSLPPVPCKMRVSLRTSYASAFPPLQLKCILHYVFSF